MLGRPNLARYNCERISLFFHTQLSSKVASEALETTHHHQSRDGDTVAYFGKLYHSQGVPYVVEGSLFLHEENEYHVSFRFFQADRKKPPRSYRSPDDLLALAIANAPEQDMQFDLLANFKYQMDVGWSPRPSVPIELPVPIRANRRTSFTHIEGVRLSNSVTGEPSDWIQVNVSSAGEITHEVGLLRSKVLNNNTVQSLIREVSGLSLGMVSKIEVIADGN